MNFSFSNLIKAVQKDASAKVLVLSNLITIFLAVAFNWSVMIILWTYWLQSVIIGFFNFLRILTLKDFSTESYLSNGKPLLSIQAAKFGSAVFFVFHYGFFHLVYAVFLSGFSFASAIFSGTIFFDFGFVVLGGIIFFFNHLFSFLYFRNKPKKIKPNLGKIMMFPYARIIPMHLTIIFGGIFLATGIGSAFVVVLFLSLKTLADLIMHSVEHKEQF